uniref:(northern house mosquito) hypothetical protein n=1 Tax=Culex pipiens TaxID=7175 RepID=A0A8D8BL35_CULPI
MASSRWIRSSFSMSTSFVAAELPSPVSLVVVALVVVVAGDEVSIFSRRSSRSSFSIGTASGVAVVSSPPPPLSDAADLSSSTAFSFSTAGSVVSPEPLFGGTIFSATVDSASILPPPKNAFPDDRRRFFQN